MKPTPMSNKRKIRELRKRVAALEELAGKTAARVNAQFDQRIKHLEAMKPLNEAK